MDVTIVGTGLQLVVMYKYKYAFYNSSSTVLCGCYSSTAWYNIFFPFQDLVNGFTCVCATGWDGDKCQFDRNECTLQQCQNGATCIVRKPVLCKYTPVRASFQNQQTK